MASRSARLDCARSTRSCFSCAARQASVRRRGRGESGSPRSTAPPASAPARSSADKPMATSDVQVPVSYDEWRAAYGLTPERDAAFTTLSGEEIKPLYTEADLPDPGRIGMPGQFPFTRGVYPSMYRGRLWTMRQFAGFGTAEETN